MWHLRRRVGHQPVVMPSVQVLLIDELDRVYLQRRRDVGTWERPDSGSRSPVSLPSHPCGIPPSRRAEVLEVVFPEGGAARQDRGLPEAVPASREKRAAAAARAAFPDTPSLS
jgi:hypothetical protein